MVSVDYWLNTLTGAMAKQDVALAKLTALLGRA